MIERIALILDDLFGIPYNAVDETDDLVLDWGLDFGELTEFEIQFCKEFNIPKLPINCKTVQDYLELVK